MLHLTILREEFLGRPSAPGERVEHPRRTRGRACIARFSELSEKRNPLRTGARVELLGPLTEMSRHDMISTLQLAGGAFAAELEARREEATSPARNRAAFCSIGASARRFKGGTRRTSHSRTFASRGGSRDPKSEGDDALRARRDTTRQDSQHRQQTGAEQRPDRRVR